MAGTNREPWLLDRGMLLPLACALPLIVLFSLHIAGIDVPVWLLAVALAACLGVPLLALWRYRAGPR